MARGGARPGSGRPKGVPNKRHKVIVEDPSELTPVAWMLAVLRDPEAEQHRRDTMAIQSAPYCHARLSAAMVSSHVNSNSRDNGDTNVLQILAVPRGCRIEKDGAGAITIEGEAAELKPIEPFVGTPPVLADQRDYKRVEPEPFEATEITPPENVVRLNPYKRDDDSNDEPQGAA